MDMENTHGRWIIEDKTAICSVCGYYICAPDENTVIVTPRTCPQCCSVMDVKNQEAKQDAGKLQLSLVPTQIIRDIAAVRQWSMENKYKDPDNWKQVEPKRFVDALYRHWLAFVDDPESKDEESGLPHLWHAATNMAFLCEMMYEDRTD